MCEVSRWNPSTSRDPLARVRPAVLIEELGERALVRLTPEVDERRALSIPPACDPGRPVDPESRHVIVLEHLRERRQRTPNQQRGHRATLSLSPVLLIPTTEGHLAVAQPEHGRMCGQLCRAWGNHEFGEVIPRAEVCRAATLHDDGWLSWEREPTLDPRVGLPYTFRTAPFRLHLRIHAAWSHELSTSEPYPGLLVSLHHASFFKRPGQFGRLRDGGRRITAFLDDLEGLQRELKSLLGVPEEQVERNRRLVRIWDGLSHDLLLDQVPRVHKAVPCRAGVVDLTIERDGADHIISPWPFAEAEVTVTASARELRGRFTDERTLCAALSDAPVVELSYTLRPGAGDDSVPSISARRSA